MEYDETNTEEILELTDVVKKGAKLSRDDSKGTIFEQEPEGIFSQEDEADDNAPDVASLTEELDNLLGDTGVDAPQNLFQEKQTAGEDSLTSQEEADEGEWDNLFSKAEELTKDNDTITDETDTAALFSESANKPAAGEDSPDAAKDRAVEKAAIHEETDEADAPLLLDEPAESEAEEKTAGTALQKNTAKTNTLAEADLATVYEDETGGKDAPDNAHEAGKLSPETDDRDGAAHAKEKTDSIERESTLAPTRDLDLLRKELHKEMVKHIREELKPRLHKEITEQIQEELELRLREEITAELKADLEKKVATAAAQIIREEISALAESLTEE